MDNELNGEEYKKQNPFTVNKNKDVFYLEGYFFIKESAIRSNTALVQKTVDDLYKYVNFN